MCRPSGSCVRSIITRVEQVSGFRCQVFQMNGFDEFAEYDRSLFARLPAAFLEGAHLSALYTLSHPKNQLNEMDAFRMIRNRGAELPLSPETILSVYGVMTAGTERQGQGFRTGNCYVQGREYFYVAAAPEDVPDAVSELCGKYRHLNDPEPEFFDDIFRFALEFICIHPMADGNGRLSVFLTQLLLARMGLACAVYLPLDFVQRILHAELWQLQVLKASGMFYGHKPLEYDAYTAFLKKCLSESYLYLDEACRKYAGNSGL